MVRSFRRWWDLDGGGILMAFRVLRVVEG